MTGVQVHHLWSGLETAEPTGGSWSLGVYILDMVPYQASWATRASQLRNQTFFEDAKSLRLREVHRRNPSALNGLRSGTKA